MSMSATATRPAHFVRWISRPQGAKAGVVEIQVGKATDWYWCRPVPSPWGVAFELTKWGGVRAGETYVTTIDPLEGKHACTCPAGQYRFTCKHREALFALLGYRPEN